MRSIALVIALVAVLIAPAFAQKAEIEAVNAKWIVSDPKLTTLDVKPLGPSAAREIGTFSLKTKGPTPQEVTGKYLVGEDWKRLEARSRHLE